MSVPATVAVIGAGPTGLSMLKTLREDGFQVTCFERRTQVGGLWAYTDDTSMTTSLRETTATLSKYTCGMSDFPIPDKYPHHLAGWQFQEFMQSYAENFNLLQDLVFSANLKRATRNESDTKWRLELDIDGKPEIREFDKVAFTHGYQTKAKMPKFEGHDKFEGAIMHAQQYRSSQDFAGKRVVVVGIGSTAGDVIEDLLPVASKLFVSHRRGAAIFRKWRKGTPTDLIVNWRKRRITTFLQRHLPTLCRWAGDLTIRLLVEQAWGPLDPAWGLAPFPSPVLVLPSASEAIIPGLRAGTLTSVRGVRRFAGPRALELDDGTVLDDVDAVICATGYEADFDVAPFVRATVTPEGAPDYEGAPLVRLWMNMFPPEHADSVVMLCHSAFGKSNGFSFCDVQSMAVSNVWRGVHPLPSRSEMEAKVDDQHRWVVSRWRLDNKIDISMVRQWEFQSFLHDAAGTGMDSLGWGWKGWKFWFKDPEMYRLMNHGVETAYAYRFFETGKRKTWPGAREAIIHANELVAQFPLKEKSS